MGTSAQRDAPTQPDGWNECSTHAVTQAAPPATAHAPVTAARRPPVA